MRKSHTAAFLLAAGLLSANAESTQSVITGSAVVPLDQAERAVAIDVDSMNANGVEGTIVNRTGRPIDAVELSVTYGWLWRNERNPGHNDPGWNERHVLEQRLEPDASMHFALPAERAMPARDDGRIVPSVGVVGFVEYEPGR